MSLKAYEHLKAALVFLKQNKMIMILIKARVATEELSNTSIFLVVCVVICDELLHFILCSTIT